MHYNDYGFLGSVRRGSLVLWNVLQQDPAGRVTSAALGNGLTQTDVYSPTSTRLTGATLLAANGTRRLEEGYGYDKLGNVSYRNQQWNGHGFIETFDYDELNRLKSSAIGSDVKTINYHPDGRIRNKTGVGSGDYAYPTPGAGSVRPNGVTSIAGIGNFQYDDNGNLLSGAGRTISWTAFDMPMTIAKGGASGTFVYGPEHQRARQDRGDGTSVVYADRQETELGAGGSVTLKTYWPLGIGVEIDRPGRAASVLLHVNPKDLISQQSRNEITGSVTKRLEKDVRINGFDKNQPVTAVVRSDGRLAISDGHRRTQAAIRAGITEIPVEVFKP